MEHSGNTVVIGSEIIRLPACPDTNNYTAKAVAEGRIAPGTVIMADYQSAGRGRRHKSWQSEPSKNLTFSFALDTSFLPFDHLFMLSKAIAVALAEALKAFDIPETAIKWPNDILASRGKLAGVLIENQGTSPRRSVCGIGFNVNQMEFGGLPSATSMAACSGRLFHRDEVLHGVLKQLNRTMDLLYKGEDRELSDAYLKLLYGTRRDVTIRSDKGSFPARILHVDPDGALRVTVGKGVEKKYYLDEVKIEYPG